MLIIYCMWKCNYWNNWNIFYDFIFEQILQLVGVFLFFIVIVVNEVGNSVRVICFFFIYDMIIFGGRMIELFRFISNFRIFKGIVIVYDDFVIVESNVVVGFGKDLYGEQIIRWSSFKIEVNIIDYNVCEYQCVKENECWYCFLYDLYIIQYCWLLLR